MYVYVHRLVAVDAGRNEAPPGDGGRSGDRDVCAPGAAARTLVVAAREDPQIAASVGSLLVGFRARAAPGAGLPITRSSRGLVP